MSGQRSPELGEWSPSRPLDDKMIRGALLRGLRSEAQGQADTVVLEELGLRHGLARVDIVVVNSYLHGFEIKSDRDTLGRLSGQLRVFNSVLDRATLVVGWSHADEALRVVPEWWGVSLAYEDSSGDVCLLETRGAGHNPCPDARAVAALLWRDEVLSVLEEVGAAEGVRSKPRAALYHRLVESVEPAWLRSRVCQQIRSRGDWRSGAQRMLGDG